MSDHPQVVIPGDGTYTYNPDYDHLIGPESAYGTLEGFFAYVYAQPHDNPLIQDARLKAHSYFELFKIHQYNVMSTSHPLKD